jgi:hypothetical protein
LGFEISLRMPLGRWLMRFCSFRSTWRF